MSDFCEKPSSLFLLESGLRSFFAVFVTHILAGEVDSTLFSEGSTASLASKISWLLRYFNPLNLTWRYYSILAYRCAARSSGWGRKQLALINFEAHPHRPPTPYIVGEKFIDEAGIKRLEISGILSSQGLLSVVAAYQGVMAVLYTISPQTIVYLYNISKPLAVLGLFRAAVSKWIASKVYVEPYDVDRAAEHDACLEASKPLMLAWLLAGLSLVILAFSPYIEIQPKNLLNLSVDTLYQYMAISNLLFHFFLMRHGLTGLSNRVLCFDHWTYKLQSFGLYFLLCLTFALGLWDFIQHGYYRYCDSN